jgi:3-hydroxyacyl-CoA dehydrogenase/enoyl-CoA hydratase/carnithine racemase
MLRYDYEMAAIELETLKIVRLSPSVVNLVLDLPGTSANILNETVLNEFEKALDEIEGDANTQAVVITSAKPKIFIAGADLVAISKSLDWTADQIISFCGRGQQLFHRMLVSEKIFVAAIHGICVGGGLELTLACHGRVASDDKRTWLGLPETRLGLIPGWAGTVRLPRLIGVEKAAESICLAKNVSAREAVGMGFVDRVADADSLLDEALSLIEKIQTENLLLQIRERQLGPATLESADPDRSLQNLKARINESTGIYPEAPLVLADHIYQSADLSFEEACRSEGQTMAKVWGSSANRGLLNNFFIHEHNKKHPGFVDISLDEKSVHTIGVLGAGIMGSAIAKCFLDNGFNVRVFDVNEKHLKATDQLVAASLNGKSQRYASSLSLENMHDCDFVLETIVENRTVKAQVFERLEKIVSAQTIIATNTSAIPVDRLAEKFAYPARFCGFHFSNPVARMPIIEIICGSQSKESHIATLTALGKSIGKIPVVVKDTPGFVVNRILSSILSGAFDLLHEQWQPDEIDSVMRRFGFHAGPFEIVDLIGVDTVYYAARVMYEMQMKCVTLSPILPAIFKRNRLGRKSLAGFYRYTDENAAPEIDTAVNQLVSTYWRSERRNYSDEEIVSRILFPAVSDAAELVQQELVNDARDIDICVIHGLSFPTFRGGLLFWADQIGIAHIVESLVQMNSLRTAPSNALIAMAEESRSFYG